MKSYIGIDLGTTNSAICSYEIRTRQDGRTRIWKSPRDQNDVTPSAIYIGRRNSTYVGKPAYDSAPRSRDNVAMLFKRFMGTSTPIKLPAVDITMTPEECSSKILRELFGYLSEELREALRSNPELGTVITVPAAFNQMQKNATMEAAEQAGIGGVALMQEPVAAVMGIMKARDTNGTFLVYDLGGGTLDIALAESIGGHINLLAHGGIAMCGGRDFDRLIMANVVKPWLRKNFDLPEDYAANPAYKDLLPLAIWATERAKIELSAREEAIISLPETEFKLRDQSNKDIYLDIPIDRSTLTGLIQEKVGESIVAATETLAKSGYNPHDIDRIVFVGGPTHYKPLRDQVCSELGIKGSTEVNPMTVVAEGAALFAESIDWSSKNRHQKKSRGEITARGALDLKFSYVARTPSKEAKISIRVQGEVMPGTEYQVDSLGTGWTSGRLPLKDGATIDVSLQKGYGENRFKVSVFDDVRGTSEHKIIITRTAATIDAIPASKSVALVVLEKVGGPRILLCNVREGDRLPKKGDITVKAGESLKAGSPYSLNFQLVEGESEMPQDNRPIGVLKIKGTDFDEGVIPAGADLKCNYEMSDSGVITLKVSVPCIGFRSEKNFYSRQEGEIDYSGEEESARISEENKKVHSRLTEIEDVVEDPDEKRLKQARKKLEASQLDDSDGDLDPERVKEADEGIIEARRLMAQVRRDHRKPVRQLELDRVKQRFNLLVRQYARPSEEDAFDKLVRTAQRSIDRDENDFESHLSELRSRNFTILWRQDWYAVDIFNDLKSWPRSFSDAVRFKELVARGTSAIKNDDIDELRQVIDHLFEIYIYISTPSDDDFILNTNIIRG